jgi:hypothetical protein
LFTVNEGSVPGAAPNLVVADRISFEYHARIEQTIVGSLGGGNDPFTETGFLSKAATAPPTAAFHRSRPQWRHGGLFTITRRATPCCRIAHLPDLTMTLHDPNQTTLSLSNAAGPPVTVGRISRDDYRRHRETTLDGRSGDFRWPAPGRLQGCLPPR